MAGNNRVFEIVGGKKSSSARVEGATPIAAAREAARALLAAKKADQVAIRLREVATGRSFDYLATKSTAGVVRVAATSSAARGGGNRPYGAGNAYNSYDDNFGY